MLVLSRRKDEKICVGDNVYITIVDIKGNTVRLGFEAPKDIRIMRQEVLDRITGLPINKDLLNNESITL